VTVEVVKTIFDWVAVVLLFLTFASGVGVLITGNIINKRQERQIRQFDKDLTDAKTELGRQQERAARAEQSAAEAKQLAAEATEKAEAEKIARLRIEKQLAPRGLSREGRNGLVALAKKFPHQKLEVTQYGLSKEAVAFSKQIEDALAYLIHDL
jgi:hypothetical protein